MTSAHITRRSNFQHTLLDDSVSKFMISHSNRTKRCTPAVNVVQNNRFTDALDVKLEKRNLEKNKFDEMNRDERDLDEIASFLFFRFFRKIFFF